jgi:23S rRNA pseudouridine1911/1915/1917 synthase
MKLIKIDDNLAGKRTDKLLAEQFTQYPRAALQRLFDSRHVKLNNELTKPGIKVRAGDVISVDLSPLNFKVAEIDLPIIYEDNDVLVINKPTGIISHARGKFFDEPSVASFIRQKTTLGGDRAGIVHRLDRATSGVMICAKNQTALSWLQKQFSERKVKKKYLALVKGELPTDEGKIDMPIARNPNRPQTFMVSEDGKEAVTFYKVIKTNLNYSLVELTPQTGRTHQLRVHLSRLGHPIIGDELYGGIKAKRLMLHAKSLLISLPSKQPGRFEADTPDEFKDYIDV